MENKEKAHVISMPYASVEEAMGLKVSSFIQSLNGVWNFQLTQGTETLQESELDQKEILRPADEIVVPGVWQLQGYEQQDPPYFLQQDYPPTIGKKHVPNIDSANNMSGSYFRTVTIPKDWQRREIFICFAGVKSAFYLWVNGQKVGYSQGSMTPAEFNITEYLYFDRENSVYVEVLRYCDSTYLEGHNTWFLSGIYRDVFLYAEPKIYIGDYFLHCQFDHCYEDAILKVQVEVVNKTEDNEPIGVDIVLSQNLSEFLTGYSCDCRMVAKGNQKSTVVMEMLVKSPKKWTADGPNLYQGLIVLKDARGHVVTVKKLTFGFRTVGILNGQLLVNGLPVLLKGINRHDFDPDTGCTVSKERYEEDLKLLKRCNVNAIRTSYYPNDGCFYELCDQYGLYVMDESGVQIHPLGSGNILSSEIQWKDAMVDRMTRMVARDKNHPCVIIWSLGNEKEQGINFLEMKKEAARLDPTRPFHYEGDFEFKTSDFFSVPTSNLDWMDAIGNKQVIGKKLLRPMQKDGESKVKTIEPLDYENKPAFLSAYAPNHENGLGDIKVYMDQFEKYDNWCGGFIYDFVDQAIRRTIDGEVQWLYGGDFGENKTSGFSCATGMVASDRSLHPTAYEIKKIYQNYEILSEDLENFHVTFSKKSPFDDPNLYGIRWELLEDGETLQRGQQDLLVFEDCKSQTVALPIDPIDKIEGAEYHLNMSMHLKQPTLWGEEDHVVAWEQLEIAHHSRPRRKHTSNKELAVHDRKIKTEITGDGFSIRISKLTGDITSIVYDKKEYILAPLKLNFYRVPTDNDLDTQKEYKKKYKTRINWKKVSESYQVQKVTIENLQTEVIIQVLRKVKYIKKSLITEYVIDGSGNLFVSHQLTPKRNLIKFGTSMDISDEFSTLSWFGKGLQENYCDRQSGTKVGVYSCHVNDYVHNYLRPQENSNRTDIRWFSATTEGGEGLYFEDIEGTLLNMSAWPYTLKDLEEAVHTHDLRPKNTITLNIDYKQKGVGSEDENAAGLSDEHKLLKNRQYKYGYKICRAY